MGERCYPTRPMGDDQTKLSGPDFRSGVAASELVEGRPVLGHADGEAVLMTRIGNQTHYQANGAAPIFEELRGIVTKTIGIAEPLREALAPLADRIDLALVYGSIAKGEDRSESDVDLLVVADDLLLEELFRRLAPAEQTLGRRINPTLYTAADFRKRRQARQPFLTKVLAGDTIPLIGSEDAFTAARQPGRREPSEG